MSKEVYKHIKLYPKKKKSKERFKDSRQKEKFALLFIDVINK